MAAEIVTGRAASVHQEAAVLLIVITSSSGILGVFKPQEQKHRQRDTLRRGC